MSYRLGGMSISRRRAVFIGVLGLGSMAILTGSLSDRREVSLRFHGIETNKDWVYACMEFSNSTRRLVRYEGSSFHPEYKLFEATSGGWKKEFDTAQIIHMGTLASVPHPCTLSPSGGVVFRVHLGSTGETHEVKLRKVEVTYSHPKPTNGFWNVLPKWIRTRLPWGKDSYVIESPTFTL